MKFIQLTKFNQVNSEFNVVHLNTRRIQFYIREPEKTLTVVSLGKTYFLVRDQLSEATSG